MTAYYNENDDYAAAWLENLIAAGHIAPGIVDRRPIQDVEAFELMEFTQCHFFAGIGVWSHALRRAGWSDDRPIWTGSCPCQPFSAAGKQKGFEDERHLWPVWNRLIEQCKPSIVVGEQVDKALDWIDLVSSDLEAQSYAFGAAIISAAGFEGAHIRHRNYFVGLGQSENSGRQSIPNVAGSFAEGMGAPERQSVQPSIAGSDIRLANNNNSGLEGRTGMSECTNQLPVGQTSLVDGLGDSGVQPSERRARSISGTETGSTSVRHPDGRHDHGHSDAGEIDGLADATISGSFSSAQSGIYSREKITGSWDGKLERYSPDSGLADTECEQWERRWTGTESDKSGSVERTERLCDVDEVRTTHAPMLGRQAVDWLYGRDGKWRPVESGTFPLAHAAPARVGRLRAYGNALDAETATQFCEVVHEICDGI